ncbi:MAG: ABC transporter ATP-binding protein [Chloroflexota bacterium]
MSDLITVDNLTKRYKDRAAVSGISFAIPTGAIFGFIGPNGAGKTTTIKILTTLLQPTSGTIFVDGHDVRSEIDAIRAKIGYVPDFFGLYDEMTVGEYLDFFAGCYDIPVAERKVLIPDLLTLVDLAHREADFVEGLSRGMKQRLGLARALLHDPKLLVLDEPASGLDPRARVEFRALLKELQRMGKTIFFSSHILADVDELCTEVGIIEAGQIVAHGDVQSLRARMQSHRIIYLTVIGDHLDAAKMALSYIPEVQDITESQDQEGDWHLELKYAGDKMGVSALIGKLVTANVPLLSFREERETLEDLFMQLTEGIVS